jgi:hypothetical protein
MPSAPHFGATSLAFVISSTNKGTRSEVSRRIIAGSGPPPAATWSIKANTGITPKDVAYSFCLRFVDDEFVSLAVAERGLSAHPNALLLRRGDVVADPFSRDLTLKLNRRPHPAPARSDAQGREQTTGRILLHVAYCWLTAISTWR